MTATVAPSVQSTPSPADSRYVIDLIARWQQHDDADARERLCKEFLPLTRRLASRYRNTHEPFEDLLQVGAIGLLGALDRFDPERGTSFVAFAIPTILGELRRHFRNTAWAVHVPRRAQELALKVDRAAQQITGETGQTPQVHVIAEHLGLCIEDVLDGLQAATSRYSVSLDAPTSNAAGEELLSLVEHVGAEDEGFDLIDAGQWLATGITRLPYQERRALALRLNGEMRQIEIAQAMGCSQMQISRLLRRAVAHLREQTQPSISS